MTEARRVDPGFWKGKRVLLTGHTGFKGSWATIWLREMGAEVTGIALAPDTHPAMFDLCSVDALCHSVELDIRDRIALARAVQDARPEIVIHMAAQALVRPSYGDPVGTWETNVLGTAHLLEATLAAPEVSAVLVVTTDKVYENDGSGRAFCEDDPLGGHDPYSASKAAAEILVASYRRSFGSRIRILSARAGNVIGGGDFAADRIVPDIWRAARAGERLVLRYPQATRPWQHVLDCLAGYLLYLEAAIGDGSMASSLNFGPDAAATGEATVAELTAAMQDALGAPTGWAQEPGPVPPEAGRLVLATEAARRALGWRDRLPSAAAIAATADWYKALGAGADMQAFTRAQIAAHGG